MEMEEAFEFLRKFFFGALTVAILIVAMTEFVKAHEFYDPWCCNGNDCKPYYGEVQTTPKGYYLPEFDTLIPYKAADGTSGYAEDKGTRYKVPDDAAQYHICVMPWEPTKVRCFYAKPGGV